MRKKSPPRLLNLVPCGVSRNSQETEKILCKTSKKAFLNEFDVVLIYAARRFPELDKGRGDDGTENDPILGTLACLCNRVPEVSRWPPSGDVDRVLPGGSGDVTETVADERIAAETVLVIDLTKDRWIWKDGTTFHGIDALSPLLARSVWASPGGPWCRSERRSGGSSRPCCQRKGCQPGSWKRGIRCGLTHPQIILFHLRLSLFESL